MCGRETRLPIDEVSCKALVGAPLKANEFLKIEQTHLADVIVEEGNEHLRMHEGAPTYPLPQERVTKRRGKWERATEELPPVLPEQDGVLSPSGLPPGGIPPELMEVSPTLHEHRYVPWSIGPDSRITLHTHVFDMPSLEWLHTVVQS